MTANEKFVAKLVEELRSAAADLQVLGLAELEIGYHGYENDGHIDYVHLLGEGGTPTTRQWNDLSFPEFDLYDWALDFLHTTEPSWVDDAGSNGTIHIDLINGTVTLDHGANIVHVDYRCHSFSLTGAKEP